MKLICYRHLPTNNNCDSIFTGTLDVPINQDCISNYKYEIKEAQFIGYSVAHVFCSPMKRTLETAKIIYPNTEIVCDNRLRERDYGDWNGRIKSDIRNNHPEIFFSSGRLNILSVPPNGESFESVYKRVASFLCFIGSEFDFNSTISIVTHNGVITALKYIIKHEGFEAQRDSFQDYLIPYYVNLSREQIERINDIVVSC